VEPEEIVTAEAVSVLAAKLKTPLQIGQHLVRAFKAGFEMGVKPIDAPIVEAVLSRQINDLESQLTRNGYDSAAWSSSSRPSQPRSVSCSEANSMPAEPESSWTKCALPGFRHSASQSSCAGSG
jgi:hypothetical protein